MKLNVLSLNCQKNYNKNLSLFLENILEKREYDLFLLQEATKDVLKPFILFPEYKIVNSKDKSGRLSLSCIIYNSKKGDLEEFFYKPLFFDSVERQELKKPFQSFGIAKAILNFQGIKINVGSVHLPSGFSSKRRLNYSALVKNMMLNVKDSVVTFFGGDFNFCFKSEVKRASKIMEPEYKWVTHSIGPTLDSYYTESNLPYSWVYMNNILRFFGGRMKFKTDQLFVDKNTALKENINVRVLPYRVSDHSPVEMRLEI